MSGTMNITSVCPQCATETRTEVASGARGPLEVLCPCCRLSYAVHRNPESDTGDHTRAAFWAGFCVAILVLVLGGSIVSGLIGLGYCAALHQQDPKRFP